MPSYCHFFCLVSSNMVSSVHLFEFTVNISGQLVTRKEKVNLRAGFSIHSYGKNHTLFQMHRGQKVCDQISILLHSIIDKPTK